jgi:hypothetical protein
MSISLRYEAVRAVLYLYPLWVSTIDGRPTRVVDNGFDYFGRVALVRSRFRSFGTGSIAEPLADLDALGLLDSRETA